MVPRAFGAPVLVRTPCIARSPAPRGRARPRIVLRGAREPQTGMRDPRSRAPSRPGPERRVRNARASRSPSRHRCNRCRRAGDREDAERRAGSAASRRPVPSRRHWGPVILAAVGETAQGTTQTDAHHDPVRECPRSTSRAKAASCIAGSPTMRCDTCTRPRRMSGSLVKENGGVPRDWSFVPSSATRRTACRGTVDRPRSVRPISAS